MNVDEADRCFEKGLSYFNKGEYENALKFFTKSGRLNHSEKAFQYMNKCQEKLHVSPASEKAKKPEETKSKETPESPIKKKYTNEQVEEIKKMKSKKDFYELLGVPKTATEEEIKKQYYKLARKFHPDKNGAPGAQDVFKKIAQAYDCLTNKDKRATYDRYGSEEPEQHYRHYYEHYRDDINPEDIFDFFFKSTFGSGFTYRRHQPREYHYNNRDQREQTHNQNPNARFWSIFQLLPLIFILLSSVAYNFSKEEPIYSLSRTRKYNEQRFSKHLQVPYYVDSKFKDSYGDSSYELARVEHEIEAHHVNSIRNTCEVQRAYKARLEYQARLYYGQDQVNLLNKAKNIDLSSCYEFEKLRGKISHLYY